MSKDTIRKISDTFFDITTVSGVGATSAKVAEEKKISKKPPREIDLTRYKTIGGTFVVQEIVYEILKRNIISRTSTLLLGPTGVGKTELVANIAKEMELPLIIFDMGTMSDPIMSLVGTHVVSIEEGVTTSRFKKSRFSEVIQEPGIILLDELSRASAAANNLLFPCLDFRRELPMEYCFEDTKPIAVHPQCVFIATANLGSQYTGTHKLDRALIDRFMILEIDSLEMAQTEQALQYIYPRLAHPIRTKMITAYFAINKAHNDFTVSFSLSLRHLKMIADLVSDGFTLYDALYMVCKGIGGKDSLAAIETILKNTK
jgi:nitric oxide reductase NorQ protein